MQKGGRSKATKTYYSETPTLECVCSAPINLNVYDCKNLTKSGNYVQMFCAERSSCLRLRNLNEKSDVILVCGRTAPNTDVCGKNEPKPSANLRQT